MKREVISSLFDSYESLLTDKEKEYFTLYYLEDLSLKEIADNLKVSRSAVQKNIKNTCEKLENFESKLKILETRELLNKALKENGVKDIKTLIEKALEK